MNLLDYLLVGAYVIFLVGMGVYFNRRQENEEDYYVGGRKVRWWASGLSTMATQLGTISFVSASGLHRPEERRERRGARLAHL